MKFVLDSSVITKWLTSEGEGDVSRAINLFNKGKQGKIDFYAPNLVKYECGNAIWKKKFDIPKAKYITEQLFITPINFIDLDENLAKKTMELAINENITFYDASFIAIAEEYKADLITENVKHQRPSIKSKIKIIPLAEFK